jgi:simple sugar transport system permease protein
MLGIKINKRQEPLVWSSCLILFGALVLSLAVSAIMLALQNKPPLVAMAVLFKGAFGSLNAIQDCLIKAVPIYLCSLGVAIAFRLQIWNIGAEGQYALGAIGATWVALSFPDLPWFVIIPGMLAMAFIAGGLWGLIPAVLKIHMRANEIIVT